jgi:Glyoxalase/Bleomycin resistance protein/Dioxygenase superfamily
MTELPLMKDVFQIAYVTNDLDRAVKVMRRDHGWGEFLVLDEMPGALNHIALAFSGETMIELIKPIAASSDFYSDHLGQPDSLTIKHHHFGILIDSREQMASLSARHKALGHAIPLEGEAEGVVQYLYADCRPTLGHFLEYIRLDERGRQMFAAVPGSPFA